MFWRWNTEYAFMDCEYGEHASQREMLSQRLYSATFWGDYSGSIYSRGLYAYVDENFPGQVRSESAMHGQGLMLADGVRITRELMEVLAWADPRPENREQGTYSVSILEYPIFEESWHSDWEYTLKVESMQDADDMDNWAYYARDAVLDNLRQNITDWEGLDEILAGDEWGIALWEYAEENVGDGYWESRQDSWEEFWESADSLIVHGFSAEEFSMWVLDRYAASINNTQTDKLWED